jgi:outer membrane murein-binding lipoprotein Lpp
LKRIILIIAAVVLSLGMIGCSPPPPANGGNDTTIAQLETRIGQLENRLAQAESKLAQSGSADLASQVNTIKSDVATLKTQVSGIASPDLSGIYVLIDELEQQYQLFANSIDTHSDEILDIKSQLETIVIPEIDFTEVNAKITELQTKHANLKAQVDAIEIPDIEIPELDEVYEYVDTVKTQINSTLATMADWVNILDTKITNLTQRMTAVENAQGHRAQITDFAQSMNSLKFKANTSGSYVIILTLYGSNVGEATAITLTGVNNSRPYRVVFDATYGSDTDMRVVMIEPSPTGSPATQQNWQAGNEVLMVFGGTASYATITIGSR